MATSPSDERESLAAALNVARVAQHMSIRAAARRAGVPAATVQGWLNGRYFPTPALRGEFTTLVTALGLEDRLTSTLWTGTDDAHAVDPLAAPYLGLAPYGVADAELFFGRDAETERLALAVKAARGTASPIVVVVGGSGSGKSSLLASGLAGRECLESGVLGGWRPRFLAVDEVASAVAAAPHDPELWIVDQVEDNLVDLSMQPLSSLATLPSGVVVVMAVRSDAFARLAEIPTLGEPISRPFVMMPMTTNEVREVVRRPCERLGARVDESLVELVLRDVGLTSERATLSDGALPLLSNALMVTWANRRSDGAMTTAEYLANGGLPGSVNALAEEVYANLREGDLELAHATFLTLVRIDESAVRRRAVDLPDLTPDQMTLLKPFIQERLVSVSDVLQVQISHDALLTSWARLAGWIAQDRDRLRALDHVRHAAQAWSENARSEDLLLPLNRVPGLQDVIDGAWEDAPFTAVERDFLTASREHFATRLEIEQRTNRRLRGQRAAISGVLAIALVLAAIASYLYVQTQAVQLAAQSRQVAGNAASLRVKDPNLRAQMALTASALSDTVEGRSALLDVGATDIPTRWLGVGSSTVAASPDGRIVVRGDGAGSITVWHQDQLENSPGTSLSVDPQGRPIYALAVELLDSHYLVAVAGSDVAAIVDVTDSPKMLRSVASTSAVYSAAFSLDNRLVAFGGAASTSVWSVADVTATPVTTVPAPTHAVAFVGSSLFTAGDDRVLRWRWSNGTFTADTPLIDPGAASATRIQVLAVSPDGRTLAGAYNAPRVARWSLNDLSELPALTVGSDWINGLAYSPDGSRLGVASSDQHTYVLDVADGSTVRELTDPSKLTSVAWSGASIVTGGVDGTLRVWQEKSPIARQNGKTIWQFASDTGGRTWFAGASSGQISLWRVSGQGLVRMPAPKMPGGLASTTAIAISADGGRLSVGTRTGVLVTWDLTANGAENARTDQILPSGSIRSISFDATGRDIAAAPTEGSTVIVNRSDDGSWRTVATIGGDTAMLVAFDPERPILTLSLASNEVQIWDTSDPAKPSQKSSIHTDSTPSVQITGTGGIVVVGTDVGTVSIWDVSDPATPKLMQEHKDALSAIYGLAITPDASVVAAASADGLLWGWNLKDKSLRFELDGSFGSAYETRFIANGALLAATGETGIVRTWAIDGASVKADLCSRIGDPLTTDEGARYLPGIARASGCVK
jgi:WD40 repeat protein